MYLCTPVASSHCSLRIDRVSIIKLNDSTLPWLGAWDSMCRPVADPAPVVEGGGQELEFLS